MGEDSLPLEDATLAVTDDAPQTLEDFRRQGADQLAAGEPLAACDLLADGLARYPGDVRLRQLLGLALARTGASRAANRILEGLAAEGQADEETLGMLARTHKDLWARSIDHEEQAFHLREAYARYAAAHQSSGGYWTGINAATMALLLGRRDEAAALAQDVRADCLRRQAQSPADDEAYWIAATLAEASLLLGDLDDAARRYGEAATMGTRRYGALASTRRNARLVVKALGLDGTRIEALLKLPRVAVFTGHLIDAPHRAEPRFPPALESAVRDAMVERLAALDVGFGFASAACGGDLLFLEEVLARGGEAHVVLPYDRERFLTDSVAFPETGDWSARYRRMLGSATDVVAASADRMASGQMSYEYAFRLMDGLAGLRADALDSELVQIALWDGWPGDGPGGTASGVAWWQAARRHVEIIDTTSLMRRVLPELASRSRTAASRPAPLPAGEVAGFDPQIVGVLFADARSFSRLNEEQILAFVKYFLGAVAEQVARSPHAPIVKNTWGDGLYFVFERVEDAGLFALDLCEAIEATDWTEHHLPADIGLRIGLHAGPAYACIDPVTGHQNFLGAHVSRAARIEPITPPGEAYASGAFAALARAAQVRGFACEYVGQMPLAKGYGTFPVYVVRREHPVS